MVCQKALVYFTAVHDTDISVPESISFTQTHLNFQKAIIWRVVGGTTLSHDTHSPIRRWAGEWRGLVDPAGFPQYARYHRNFYVERYE